MGKPLLSVVVPTKNRYNYLKELIKLISIINDDRIELLIQDNTPDNTEILNFFEQHSFQFINYQYISESISMTDNSDNAVKNSTGEYICFIGDDDGITSSIMDVVEYMKKHQIDVMLGNNAIYNWPDFYDPTIFNLCGTLILKKYSFSYWPIDPIEELKKSIYLAFDNMHNMPRAYQAIVSRNVMEKVYSRCNSYFPGPSPDMANAVALSLLTPKCCYVDRPFVIAGQSKNVGGGERMTKELKSITDVTYLKKGIEKTWDERIPPYWCSDFIWPASAMEALGRMNNKKNLYTDKMLGRFLVNHRSWYKMAFQYSDNKAKLLLYSFHIFLKKALNFIINRILYLGTGKKKVKEGILYRDVLCIKDAFQLVLSNESVKK